MESWGGSTGTAWLENYRATRTNPTTVHQVPTRCYHSNFWLYPKEVMLSENAEFRACTESYKKCTTEQVRGTRTFPIGKRFSPSSLELTILGAQEITHRNDSLFVLAPISRLGLGSRYLAPRVFVFPTLPPCFLLDLR